MRLNKDIDHAKIVNYERSVLLGVIDYTWINHIDAMTKLRNGIYVRMHKRIHFLNIQKKRSICLNK